MREAVNLPRYVSLLKNLRAVIFFDPSKIPKDELGWIKRKYRYRSIGISQALLEALPNETKLFFDSKPFKVLDHPVSETKELTEIVSKHRKGEPVYIFDSLVLASCYVNPILVLRRDSFQLFEPFASWHMTSTAELPDLEIKRNLRIVSYAILDFHEKNIRKAYEFLTKISRKIQKSEKLTKADIDEINSFMLERSRLAQKDGEQRFWRLKEEGKERERLVIAYLDPLVALTDILKEKEVPDLIEFILKSTPNLSMALSLVPAFIFQL